VQCLLLQNQEDCDEEAIRVTNAEIVELRKLEAAARKGPWTEREDYADEWDIIDGNGDRVVCSEYPSARLMSVARNALVPLLDEVERARALLKRIEWTPVCHVCFMYREAGHELGCELAALISADH
jgi:hypothetical protein